MAKRRKANELTTDEAMRRLFPKKVRDELKKQAEKAKAKGPKKSTNGQSR
jgi:hypothetical protein